MTFTTLTFLLFLAFVFLVYWRLQDRRAQNAFLVVASYFFYGWWDWRFCWLMLASSLLDFGVGLGLNRVEMPGRRKLLLAAGLSGNLALLGFFKYFNFFAESLRALAGTVGWTLHPVTLQVVLPVGISFYTFQTMSYSIDIYRGRMRATTRLVDYLAYVSFFPQLVAGPIERATHLLPQFFKPRVFSHDQTVDGCRQMLWGFLKKMVIADNLAPIVDRVYANPDFWTGFELAVATVFFAFQIYCDFSAYSDIAIGVARLLGFELMRNFNCPYFSQSMGEFWRRWHISLTTWFKDYVYVPLGGNRLGVWRGSFNVLVTFLLSGLWHGAAWNYLVWGAINGGAVVVEKAVVGRGKPRVPDIPGSDQRRPRGGMMILARMLLTFGLVCLGWIFFRARSFNDACLIVHHISTGVWDVSKAAEGFSLVNYGPLHGWMYVALAALMVVEWRQRDQAHPLRIGSWPRLARWSLYTALGWLVLSAGTFGSTQFIYFQF